MTTKHLVFIFRQTPASSAAKEGLDALLAAAAFEQKISLVFLGDGVWQLQSQQDLRAINLPAIDKQLSALPMFDVDHIYMHNDSMQERGISDTNSNLAASKIDDTELSELIASADQVFTF